VNYLPGLASNCYPTNLSLQSSQDYRHGLQHPAQTVGLLVCFFFFLAVSGFELRASHLLGRCFIT
jgi:hypothetical protein